MPKLRVDTISGLGGDGVVFDGDITFDSLNYMTLPKGTTTQSNRGRGLFAGGYDSPGAGSANKNTIDYFNIQSTGNAIDFGDTPTAYQQGSALSDTHGGLG